MGSHEEVGAMVGLEVGFSAAAGLYVTLWCLGLQMKAGSMVGVVFG
jgi:hypothetical protein